MKAGDVETNPGPTTTHKQVWICYIYHNQMYGRKHISIWCNRIEHWVHTKMRRYPPSTTYRYMDLPSTQVIRTHNSHRHNTTHPLPTLVQASSSISGGSTTTPGCTEQPPILSWYIGTQKEQLQRPLQSRQAIVQDDIDIVNKIQTKTGCSS